MPCSRGPRQQGCGAEPRLTSSTLAGDVLKQRRGVFSLKTPFPYSSTETLLGFLNDGGTEQEVEGAPALGQRLAFPPQVLLGVSP